jgi:hypothetical protein
MTTEQQSEKFKEIILQEETPYYPNSRAENNYSEEYCPLIGTSPFIDAVMLICGGIACIGIVIARIVDGEPLL